MNIYGGEDLQVIYVLAHKKYSFSVEIYTQHKVSKFSILSEEHHHYNLSVKIYSESILSLYMNVNLCLDALLYKNMPIIRTCSLIYSI